jgi:hypothetical protein
MLFWGSLFSVKYFEIVFKRFECDLYISTFNKYISQFSNEWASLYESDPSFVVYVCNSRVMTYLMLYVSVYTIFDLI